VVDSSVGEDSCRRESKSFVVRLGTSAKKSSLRQKGALRSNRVARREDRARGFRWGVVRERGRAQGIRERVFGPFSMESNRCTHQRLKAELTPVASSGEEVGRAATLKNVISGVAAAMGKWRWAARAAVAIRVVLLHTQSWHRGAPA
jgi:hypothetical protein